MDRSILLPDMTQQDHNHRRRTDPMRYEHCHEAEITSISLLIESVHLYRIRFLDSAMYSTFSFSPGQFVMLELPGIGEAPFTISSNPSKRGNIELCIRSVGTLTSFLTKCRRGLQVGISGPFGTSFPLKRMQGSNILLIAGGLGMVPIRSVLSALQENRSDYGAINFLYGARNPSLMLFADELNSWRKTDINVLGIVDDPDDSWSGPVGMITSLVDDVVRRGTGGKMENCYAIVCGPPVMFKDVCNRLLSAGIPIPHIFVSLERRMHCGRGNCCRCNIGSTYVCLDGPVFDFWSVMNLNEAI